MYMLSPLSSSVIPAQFCEVLNLFLVTSYTDVMIYIDLQV